MTTHMYYDSMNRACIDRGSYYTEMSLLWWWRIVSEYKDIYRYNRVRNALEYYRTK